MNAMTLMALWRDITILLTIQFDSASIALRSLFSSALFLLLA